MHYFGLFFNVFITQDTSGVTDGSRLFGYVIYFKEADHERAERVLCAAKSSKTA